MDASHISADLVSPYFTDDTCDVYGVKKFTPSRMLMMVKWVYQAHNDFLEEHVDFFEKSGYDTTTSYEERRERVQVLKKQQNKCAKELKKMFPDVTHYNTLYEGIIEILYSTIRDENTM